MYTHSIVFYIISLLWYRALYQQRGHLYYNHNGLSKSYTVIQSNKHNQYYLIRNLSSSNPNSGKNIRYWIVRIQTTTTVRTTLPQSVFQSAKVPAWNVSNAREQMEIKLMWETRERFWRLLVSHSSLHYYWLINKSNN